jgi:hypothetical protein
MQKTTEFEEVTVFFQDNLIEMTSNDNSILRLVPEDIKKIADENVFL